MLYRCYHLPTGCMHCEMLGACTEVASSCQIDPNADSKHLAFKRAFGPSIWPDPDPIQGHWFSLLHCALPLPSKASALQWDSLRAGLCFVFFAFKLTNTHTQGPQEIIGSTGQVGIVPKQATNSLGSAEVSMLQMGWELGQQLFLLHLGLLCQAPRPPPRQLSMDSLAPILHRCSCMY